MAEQTATRVRGGVEGQAEPVAVVGLACRLPGAADPGEFWRLLASATDAVDEPGPERVAAGGAASGQRAGWLAQVDAFDPEFFGIAPAEAAAADPQQRLLLELAWEALEDAAVLPRTLHGTRTGVFVGATAGDWALLTHRRGGAPGRHALTGVNRGILANRISYTLGLRGPSLTVDTGQSSSLVAVHLALESLRSGEVDAALVAGVQLNLAEESTTVLDRFGALSPDGACRVFDADANGFARGEGAVLLVLKPLARALADGDAVHAVLLGSAVNNDGATDGLTVPGAPTQAEVVAAALADAGVSPDQVQYVELHGTGTRVGDPVEAAGLGAAFGARKGGERLHVGSVKTNIGHLEGAAGLAGLLKTVLSLRHRELPGGLHFRTPNPAIDLDALGLHLRTGHGSWPRPDQRLVAGVSSFGVGGTNAHVVLAEPPAANPPAAEPTAANPTEATGPTDGANRSDASVPPGGLLWPLSARSPQALQGQAQALLDHLGRHPRIAPHELAHALATTRTAFEHRAVVHAADPGELRDGLAHLAAGRQSAAVVRGLARGEGGGTVLVFPGQGSQWDGMARELLGVSVPFAASIRACEQALSPHVDWSLEAVLTGAPGAPALERPDVVQPVLFAVMVSLARLWEAHGVRPDAVIGHSQGEIAAAHVAGALSLVDAARVVALRSRAIAGLGGPGAGAMASLELPHAQAARRIAPWAGKVGVAAVNGPEATVISGDRDAVQEIVAGLAAEGVRARLIPVDYASHSPQVEPLSKVLPSLLEGVHTQATPVAIYSTVTGGRIDPAELTPAYWYRNLRGTVRFEDAVRAARADGHRVFVESSPHPVLVPAVAPVLEDDGVALGTLRRDQGGPDRFRSVLAELHARGGQVDWDRLLGPVRGHVALPTYAFQRRRLWLDGATAPALTPDRPDTPEPVGESDPVAESGTRPGTSPAELLETVRASAALVLGQSGPEQVDPDRSFKDQGFDSVAAVEFRERLAAATGLTLPATLAYDHPTARDVVRHLTGTTESRPGSLAAPARTDDAREPIAIVALSGRWPGGADTPEALWELLLSGRDAIGPFPDNRGWDLDALHESEGDRPGGSATRQGGFLHDADLFDAEFFGLSPREAAAADPQQRLLLQAGWELCERAGIVPADLRGSSTGVYLGITAQEYGPRLHETPEAYQGHALTGSLTSVASGRLAYTLGLQGPALTVDTACSSSLVALHLAAQALRRGECDLAFAGGAAVMSSPGMFTEFSRQGGLARDGRCKPFAAAADGTAWSEGVGLVLLERLSDARAHGHPVLAVVRGTAINQDGASNGLTAPNGPAQERVIRAALADAGLTPADVDAVEAHGTGTTLGDPIEARALIAVHGTARPADRPLLLGSLKSHIGHTQAAAGVTGVIATVQALREGVLPGLLHLDAPSPHVDWTAGTVRLLDRTTPWPDQGRVRRAGVSSFGISGTNAHVVIEQAPPVQEPARQSDEPSVAAAGTVPLLLSARDEEGLRAQARRLAQAPGLVLGADTARALATTRSRFPHRAVVLGAGPDERAERLRAFAAGGDAAAQGVAGTAPSVAVLLSGQGSQRPSAGKELYAAYPVFARALDAIAERFDRELEVPLRRVLFAAPGTAEATLLDRTAYTQPALFALQTALYRLAESFGVRAERFLGHSVGELTAAHLAGVLDLDDAVTLVAARARLMQALPGGGAMAALEGSEDDVAPLLAGRGGSVALAAVNGPRAVVVSGDAEEVHELARRWRQDGRRSRLLTVSHAFHSPHMEPMLAEFREVAARLSYAAPHTAVVSNLTGRTATAEELADPDYWAHHVREAVRFHDGVRTLAAEGTGAYLELGPGAVLTALVRDAVDEEGAEGEGAEAALATPVLRAGTPEPDAFMTALARLYVEGVPVDWTPAFPSGRAAHVPLPTYPFRRTRHWLAAPALRPTGPQAPDHPFLDNVVDLPDGAGSILTGTVSLNRHPWLADHAVAGQVLLPGTAFLDLVLRAAAEAASAHAASGHVEELTLEAPLPLAPGRPVHLQLALGAADTEARRTVTLHARSTRDEAWRRLATATVTAESRSASPSPWEDEAAERLDVDQLYADLVAAGYGYGPAFRLLTAARRAGETVFAETSGAEHAPGGRFAVQPAVLDAVLHAVVGFTGDGTPSLSRPRVPFAWHGVTLHQPLDGPVRARVRPLGVDAVAVDLVDAASGAPVLSVDRLTLRQSAFASGAPEPERGYAVAWTPVVPDPAAVAPEATTEVARVADADEALARIRAWLDGEQAEGARLALVTWNAVAVDPSEDVPDPRAAAAWGLVRTAQAEHPGRLLLADVDGTQESDRALAAALDAALNRGGEAQLAVRAGEVLLPALDRPRAGDTLALPDGAGAWRLDTERPGSLDSLALLPAPEAQRPLGPGEVRLALRAAGLNFRDVLIALGLYPGGARIGAEASGVVLETGPGVTALRPGDRVFGLVQGTLGPVAVTDHRLLAPIPAGWGWAEAAGVPVAFLTARYGLFELAGLRPGERVLVHAAAGGVGQAAIQLAHRAGAEVLATAGPGKWPVLRGLGVAPHRIASSRTLDFETAFREAGQDGTGADVVLNSLAREFTDASLRLLGDGGRFVELGKTDLRDAAQVAADHPGVRYQAFDLFDVDRDQVRAMFDDLLTGFADGSLRPLPVVAQDIRHAPTALRRFSQAKHTGKLVVTLPQPPVAEDGTVLLTGGTGALGTLVARRLVERHGVRRLLLVGRQGPAAPGAAQLLADLAALGAHAEAVACDVADGDAVARLVAGVAPEHPLTAVVHLAGVLDDAPLEALTSQRLHAVAGPKSTAAWHLHRATAGLDLRAFVLFSSAVGLLGNLGQANYAAANAELDGLAQHRRVRGLPGISLAWGHWAQAGGLAAALDDTQTARLAATGLGPMTDEQALALFDAAWTAPESLLATAALDPTRGTSPLLRGLAQAAPAPTRVATKPDGPALLLAELAPLAEPERQRRLVLLVRRAAAAVLGHPGPEAIRPGVGFMDAAFDSLGVIELRNRLGEVTGLRLPTTVTLDHPTPAALAAHLHERLFPAPEEPVAELPVSHEEPAAGAEDLAERIADASDDEIFALLDHEFGLSREAHDR